MRRVRKMRPWQETENNLANARTEMTKRSRQHLGSDIDGIDESFATLRDLMPKVFTTPESGKWGSHSSGIAMLLAWSFGRLVNAYRLLLEGYLSDAVVLVRAAWEGQWQLIAFDIEASQPSPKAVSKLHKWMQGQWVGPKDVREILEGHLPGGGKKLAHRYDVMSNLSHPANIGAVQLQVEEVEGAGEKVMRFSLDGIQRPGVSDAILALIREQVLTLIGYVPLAFPHAVDDPDALDTWRREMLVRHRQFEDARVPSPSEQS